MGICFDLQTSKRVVVKLMVGTDRLKREAEFNELLDGKAVETTKMICFVPTSTSGKGLMSFADGTASLTFSYMVIPLKGLSLVSLLMQANTDKVHLSWSTKRYLCSQVVHCVRYLHMEKGLAHLDLKGDNFVLDAEFCLSLIDFGMTERLDKLLKDRNKMTPRYRAPEIKRDLDYLGGPADVFGVGVCLFMIMFQDAPFSG